VKKLLFSVLFSSNVAIASPLLYIQEGAPPQGLCQTTVESTFKKVMESGIISNALWQRGEDKHIASSTSKILIWESRPHLILGCRKPSDWMKASDILPGDGNKVISFFSKKCSFDDSIKNENDVVYIVFHEKLGKINDSGIETVTRYFYSHDDWFKNPVVRSEKTYNNYHVSDYSYHEFPKVCFIIKR